MGQLTFKADAEIIGLTALVMADAAAFLSGVNPSLFTMRAFTDAGGAKADNTKNDIRLGSAIGSGLALIAGVGASLVSKSWWPIIGTVVTLVVIIGSYEWAINNPHGYGANIGAQ
jgi:hypothetical protein